jgi:hypothetical protein
MLRPGGFILRGREIAQTGMNALVIINVVETAANLLVSIVKVLVVRQVDFFFLNGTDDAFDVAILPSLPTSAMLMATFASLSRST